MNSGASWNALLSGHLQVANGGYPCPKQSSFRDLNLLYDLEIL